MTAIWSSTRCSGVFCRTDQPFRALCRCIEVVHRGEFWVSNEQLGYVIEALRGGIQRRVVNAKSVGLLPPWEEQVANLVAGGGANREVAQQLGVKESTIKKFLLRIYDKLGVSNRVELVLYVLTHQGTSNTERIYLGGALELWATPSARAYGRELQPQFSPSMPTWSGSRHGTTSACGFGFG